ncbi:MAG TPA: hypothetical protein VIV06_05760 [Candidatus Limnocylindrales bacterium]
MSRAPTASSDDDPSLEAAAPSGPPEVGRAEVGGPSAELAKRPPVERIGLALVALVVATLFGVVAVASFGGGDPFLGVMGAIGALMTLWVGGLTLIRG